VVRVQDLVRLDLDQILDIVEVARRPLVLGNNLRKASEASFNEAPRLVCGNRRRLNVGHRHGPEIVVAVLANHLASKQAGSRSSLSCM